MNTSPSEDSDSAPDMEELLREAQMAPLADDGFSTRVLRALPAPRRAVVNAPATRRSILCSLGLAAGIVLGLAHKDETTWAPVVALADKLASEQNWELLLRFDSPLWIAALALGGTFAILKYLERPQPGSRMK